jgi:molybdate transport system substrate-binding protein
MRAKALVGGRNSAPIPTGKLAAEWIIHGGQAEVFIGYASYAATLREVDGLMVIDIPAAYNPRAEYACAVVTPKGRALAEYLVSAEAKMILQQAGFGA